MKAQMTAFAPKGEASLRGHLKNDSAPEATGSVSYVPKEKEKDVQLKAAIDLLHGKKIETGKKVQTRRFPRSPHRRCPTSGCWRHDLRTKRFMPAAWTFLVFSRAEGVIPNSVDCLCKRYPSLLSFSPRGEGTPANYPQRIFRGFPRPNGERDRVRGELLKALQPDMVLDRGI